MKIKMTERQMKHIKLETNLPSSNLLNEDVTKYKENLKSFIKNNIKNTKDAIPVIKNVLKQISNLNNKTKKQIIKTLVISLLTVIGPAQDEEKIINTMQNSSIDPNTVELFNDILNNQAEEVSEKISEDEGNLNDFLNKLAFKESNNDWTVFKDAGDYIGKYQFSQIALQDINKNIDPQKFKQNPNIFPEEEQDKAVVDWLQKNEQYLKDEIKKYHGKVVNGIPITKSGILAGAHLLGANNVKDFFKNGEVPKDGNGTPITEYMKELSGYNLNI